MQPCFPIVFTTPPPQKKKTTTRLWVSCCGSAVPTKYPTSHERLWLLPRSTSSPGQLFALSDDKQPNGVVLELQTTIFKLDVWLTTISQVKNLESSNLNNHFKVNVSGSRVKSNRDKKRISKFYSPEKQKANATENRPYPKRKGSSPKHRFSGASREFQAGCTHLQSRFDTCLPCLGSWPLWKNLL